MQSPRHPSPCCLKKIFPYLALSLLLVPSLQAATYYWTPSSAATGTWAVSGGTNQWSLTSGNPTPNAAWVAGSVSTFERSATMTIGSASLAIASLNINSGSTLTLLQGSGARDVTVSAASSGNLVINASSQRTQLLLQDSYDGMIEAANNDNSRVVLGNATTGGVNAKINLTGGTLALNNGVASTTAVIGELKGTAGLITANFNTVVGTRTLEVNQATNTVFAGTTTAGTASRILALKKSGSGTLELTGTNLHDGATTITGGTLLISGSGSINGTSSVIVNGGTLNYSSSVALNKPLTFTSGTLAGTNYSGQTLSIGANQTLSPGSSTGTLSSLSQTWATGGTYAWELNNTAGTAGGTGWDLMNISGSLNLTATSGGKFTINVLSLNGSQTTGITPSFNGSQNYQWLIADATSAITGFDATAFTINLAGFQNPYSGTWSVALGNQPGIGGDNSQIYLTYAAIPEPSVALLFGVGIAVVIFRRRQVSC